MVRPGLRLARGSLFTCLQTNQWRLTNRLEPELGVGEALEQDGVVLAQGQVQPTIPLGLLLEMLGLSGDHIVSPRQFTILQPRRHEHDRRHHRQPRNQEQPPRQRRQRAIHNLFEQSVHGQR